MPLFLKKYLLLLLFSIGALTLQAQSPANDDCSEARFICTKKLTETDSGTTTIDATPDGSLSCSNVDNSVWFYFKGLRGGKASVRITEIDSMAPKGLEMEIFESPDCNCGSLQPIANTCDSAMAPSRDSTTFMLDTVTTHTDSCYYILIDGLQGTEERFTIEVSPLSGFETIVREPEPAWETDPLSMCVGDTFWYENNSRWHGDTNSYGFNAYMAAPPFMPTVCSSNDSSTCLDNEDFWEYTTAGNYYPTLMADNKCPGKEFVTVPIEVNNLQPDISPIRKVCGDSAIPFKGSASLIPDGGDPSIYKWRWEISQSCGDTTIVKTSGDVTNPDTVLYDPCSAVQSVHVKLVGYGLCGPDSVDTVFTPEPPLEALIYPDTVTLCEERDTLMCVNTSILGGNPPYKYDWSGPVTPSPPDSACTRIGNLPPGGPYEYKVRVTDALGCISYDSVYFYSNPKPLLSDTFLDTMNTTCAPGKPKGFCANQRIAFSYTIEQGTPPYYISWQPDSGLIDTIQYAQDTLTDTAYAVISDSSTYRIILSDASGCYADTNYINFPVLPGPRIDTTPICARDTQPMTTFSVKQVCPNATYNWSLSSPYDTLLNNTVDSSVQVDFTHMPPGQYDFEVAVSNQTTGCLDTIAFTYTLDSTIFRKITGDSQLCPGECTTLKAIGKKSGVDYTWIVNNTVVDSNQQVNMCPDSTTTYYVIAQDSHCTVLDSFTVEVASTLQSKVNVLTSPFVNCNGDTSYCKGQEVAVQYQVQQGNPPFTITWQPAQAWKDTLQMVNDTFIDKARLTLIKWLSLIQQDVKEIRLY